MAMETKRYLTERGGVKGYNTPRVGKGRKIRMPCPFAVGLSIGGDSGDTVKQFIHLAGLNNIVEIYFGNRNMGTMFPELRILSVHLMSGGWL
jgi:hypothetical protein